MKGFLVVSLVCFFGAVSAAPAETPDECKQQAYVKVVDCAKHGFDNGTAGAQCMSDAVLEYYNCKENSSPELGPSTAEPPLGATNIQEVIKDTIKKSKCIFNLIVESLKCIATGHLNLGVPFKVNMDVIIKCLVRNVPAATVCLIQN